MKFKTHGMLLSLFLALGLVFSFSIEVSGTHSGADSGITAAEVDPGNQQNMEDFVDHIVSYYEKVRAEHKDDTPALIRNLTIFARDIRREGDYKHGDVYAIGITENGVVTNHAKYPGLIGYRVNPDAEGSAVAATLKALLDNSAVGSKNCENYGQNNEKVACAAKVVSDLTVDVTNIAGLHHAEDDPAFVKPDCEGLALGTTAEDVYNNPTDANLEAYVKAVIDAVQKDIGKITVKEIQALLGSTSLDAANLIKLAEPGNQEKLAGKLNTSIQERLFCFGSGDFKHRNIYLFIMDANLESPTVIINGNNFDLNGGNLKLQDNSLSGERNIARLFNQKLGSTEPGSSAYVDYHWDDPTTTEDDVENWFENNVVPGDTPKRSYIEVADLKGQVPEELAKVAEGIPASLIRDNLPPIGGEQIYIFGSGIYNPAASGGDDGGCSVAGTGHASRSAPLNLLLIACVLLPAVFLGRRARKVS